jgi:ribonuclease BN (tRNA processing enzyme)
MGTGNFFSTRRYHTSLLLLAGEFQVLIDCPDPFFRICADAARASGRKIDPERIDHVIITHLHGDHCNGLEGFGFWRRFCCERPRRPRLYTSHEVARLLWPKLCGAMGEATSLRNGSAERYGLDDYFEVLSFEFGEAFSIGPLRIETFQTRHTLPCFAFRATAGGRTFGYSADTAFDPRLIDFLGPCDLIFHETDFGPHTALEDLESLPEPTRRRMRLIHLDDAFAGSSKIEVAEEGRVYPVR